MKTSSDPRHQARIKRVQALFAHSFQPQNTPSLTPVLEVLDQLDAAISAAAPDWPLDKINRIDLAILRTASYELLFTETPPKVIIDEAVEIGKKYGSDSTPSFVNGVLGTILAKKEGSHGST